MTSLLRISGFPGGYGGVVSGQPMLKVERLHSQNGKVRGISGISGPLPPTLSATTFIFNTNLHIAHRNIPRKFGVPGYHRFCAAPPTHVCGRRTDRRLCHSKDEHCLARRCSSKTLNRVYSNFFMEFLKDPSSALFSSSYSPFLSVLLYLIQQQTITSMLMILNFTYHSLLWISLTTSLTLKTL